MDISVNFAICSEMDSRFRLRNLLNLPYSVFALYPTGNCSSYSVIGRNIFPFWFLFTPYATKVNAKLNKVPQIQSLPFLLRLYSFYPILFMHTLNNIYALNIKKPCHFIIHDKGTYSYDIS